MALLKSNRLASIFCRLKTRWCPKLQLPIPNHSGYQRVRPNLNILIHRDISITSSDGDRILSQVVVSETIAGSYSGNVLQAIDKTMPAWPEVTGKFKKGVLPGILSELTIMCRALHFYIRIYSSLRITIWNNTSNLGNGRGLYHRGVSFLGRTLGTAAVDVGMSHVFPNSTS
jgi:hypothetical protein